MRKVLMNDGEFVLTVNDTGTYIMYHQHTEPPGALELLVADDVCVMCLAKAPEALSGMRELCKWEK